MTTEELLKMWKKIELNSYYGLPKTDHFYFANVKTADSITNTARKFNPGDVTFKITDWWDHNESKGKQIFNENDPYGEELWEE